MHKLLPRLGVIAADFGWGGDQTQNILWRLENGELDGVNPKVVVLLAGTNNVGNPSVPGGADATASGVAQGLQAIVRAIQTKAPGATIIVTPELCAELPSNAYSSRDLTV